MIFWILYLFSFLLHWYENKTIVLPIEKRPLIFSQRPYFQSLLFVIRLICQYGSIVGVWWVYGLFVAIVAFVISYVFGKLTFSIYRSKEMEEEDTWRMHHK
jgi:hypothetical protein